MCKFCVIEKKDFYDVEEQIAYECGLLFLIFKLLTKKISIYKL